MAMAEQDRYAHARSNAKGWFESIEEMLAAQNAAAKDGGIAAIEESERAVHESVLSIEVRSAWVSCGDWDRFHSDRVAPDEYCILLSTGGPALRIVGQLDQYGQPSSAEMQMQDWGIVWERYPAPEATLLEFVSQFCFYNG
jgi:hypothetical protein